MTADDFSVWLARRLQRSAPDHIVYLDLLPLLEQPWRDVQERLHRVHQAGSLPMVASISMPALVACALGASPYWGVQAVNWLDDGFPIDVGLAQRMVRLAEEESIPQPVRHRAFALVRRFQRGLGIDS